MRLIQQLLGTGTELVGLPPDGFDAGIRALVASTAPPGEASQTSTALLYAWSAGWAEAGFPRIVVGHRHAAALMATHTSPAAIPEARTPWEAFLIDVPEGLITVPLVTEHGTRPYPVRHAMVLCQNTSRDLVTIQYSDGDSVDFSTGTQQGLSALGEFTGCGPGFELLARYVLGVCLEMTEHRPAPRGGGGPSRRLGPPTCQTYRLTRDVKVDCREAVRAYARGEKRTAPSVQSLVRGHWKRQPCGEGRTDRKFIFVEPYWRGPEDAPIAVRRHIVEGRTPESKVDVFAVGSMS